MRSVPSLSSIMGMGDWVLVFSISSCITEVGHIRSRGFGKWGGFLAQNYMTEQSANYVEYSTHYIPRNTP